MTTDPPQQPRHSPRSTGRQAPKRDAPRTRPTDRTQRRQAIEQVLRTAWTTDALPAEPGRRPPMDGRDWETVRREALAASDWRRALEQAQLAESLAASHSVPDLYENDPVPEVPTPRASSRTAEQFFAVNEVEIDSVSTMLKEIARVQDRNARFRLVWRGQQDVAWPVASSLMRDLRASGDAGEDDLIQAEREMMAVADEWGVASAPPLRFLAELQHMGAPTRLLDASTDPEVSMWFAVEQHEERDEHDARVLAWARDPVPSGGGEIEEPPPLRDGGEVPFWHAWTTRAERVEVGWGTGSRTWSWFPPPLNERMRAQRAGFLLEAEPVVSDRVLDVFAEALGSRWRGDELAGATTVLGLPSRHDVVATSNPAHIVPLFSFRIRADAKPAIREFLANKGLTVDRIYPDQTGLVSHLRRRFG